jgi:polyhydroxybutyrate depolymerase
VDLIILRHGGSDRRYRWYPATESPAPTILFLHGTGGSAEWVESETGLAEAAKEAGFALGVPDALAINPDQPPRFLTNPQRWNDGSAWQGDLNYKGENDSGFLAAVIRELPKRGADPKRVCVAGFSNGAGMTFRLAAEHPELVAAIAPVAGLKWVDPTDLPKPIPTIYLIGDADPLVPLGGGPVQTPWGQEVVNRPSVYSTLALWAAVNGCNPQPHEIMDGREVRFQFYEPRQPGARMHAVIIPGLGHHWPGGAGQMNPRIAGAKGSIIDGNEMVLEFFKKYAAKK